jgi:hypothetical protein
MSGIFVYPPLEAILRRKQQEREKIARAARLLERKQEQREAAGETDFLLPRSGMRPIAFRGTRLIDMVGNVVHDGLAVHRLQVFERVDGGFVVSLCVAPGEGRANSSQTVIEISDSVAAAELLASVEPSSAVSCDLSSIPDDALQAWSLRTQSSIEERMSDRLELMQTAFGHAATSPFLSVSP